MSGDMAGVRDQKFRCVIHGSFNKHFALIQSVHDTFTRAGIQVLAPRRSQIKLSRGGFALLEGEENRDPRLVELLYLHNLKRLGRNGFSYFVNPEGYVGRSASYELGIAQLTNTRCFFYHRLHDHPAYVHRNAVWRPEALADYVMQKGELPAPRVRRSEARIHQLWEDLMVPGSVIATGAIIDHDPGKSRREREILLVKTHKWDGRYSVVGGRVRRNERLRDALHREIREETGLRGEIGRHLATFDQLKNSGYYDSSVHHVYVDNVFTVRSKNVSLNEEAEDYIWIRPSDALRYLEIEPNARHIVEIYAKTAV
jgi:ADP-ribose pyrophosphatase YjhB (NUDIX family)